MMDIFADVPSSWRPLVSEAMEGTNAVRLAHFLQQEAAAGEVMLPPSPLRFAALQAVAPADVKVVILGQDPYHGPGQAMGLSFSVPLGVHVPPSLGNIYKELTNDVGFVPPHHGDLTAWAEQGVLLLNSVLSVRAGQPGSHAKQGWEVVTDALVRALVQRREHLVFMLWGSYAQRKASGVDRDRHLVLTAPHPSPLSAYRGFLGCAHFSQANQYLLATGQPAIDWQL
ncbi:MAG: uracil-DNA glycosylase [Natronospirillum sp.]